jgi:hypothetical protein
MAGLGSRAKVEYPDDLSLNQQIPISISPTHAGGHILTITMERRMSPAAPACLEGSDW